MWYVMAMITRIDDDNVNDNAMYPNAMVTVTMTIVYDNDMTLTTSVDNDDAYDCNMIITATS